MENISRRGFLKGTGAGLVGLGLSACGVENLFKSEEFSVAKYTINTPATANRHESIMDEFEQTELQEIALRPDTRGFEREPVWRVNNANVGRDLVRTKGRITILTPEEFGERTKENNWRGYLSLNGDNQELEIGYIEANEATSLISPDNNIAPEDRQKMALEIRFVYSGPGNLDVESAIRSTGATLALRKSDSETEVGSQLLFNILPSS